MAMYVGPAISGILHLGLLALALAPARPEPFISPDGGPPVEVSLMSLEEYNAAIADAPEAQPQSLEVQPLAAETALAMAIPRPVPSRSDPVPQANSVDAATEVPELALDSAALRDEAVDRADILPQDRVRIVTAPDAPEQPRGVMDAPDIDTDPDQPPEPEQITEPSPDTPASTEVAEAEIQDRNGAPPMNAPLPRPKPRGSLAAESTDEDMPASPVAEAGESEAQRNAEAEQDRLAEVAREALERAALTELAEAEKVAEAERLASTEEDRIRAEDARIAAEDARIAAEAAAAELAEQRAAEEELAEAEAEAAKEARRLAEAELERLRAEEDAARLAAEEEARRLAEAELERQRAAEEEVAARLAAQEEAKRLAEAELERQRLAEQEAARKAAEEAAAKLAEEQRRMREEADALRLAEAEAEARRNAFLEQQAALRAEQERQRQLIEEERARMAFVQEQQRIAEEQRQAALRRQQLEQFNAGSRIAQQTDRNLGAGGGAAPGPAADPFMAMLGNAVGTPGASGGRTFSGNVAAQNNAAPLTQGEQQQLLNQLARCWRMMGQTTQIVTMRVSLTREGRVSNAVPISGSGLPVENAFRALQDPSCQPFPLPPQKYGSWQQIDIVFDPRRMTLQ